MFTANGGKAANNAKMIGNNLESRVINVIIKWKSAMCLLDKYKYILFLSLLR